MPAYKEMKDSKKIKEACIQILINYNKACEGFLNQPGPDGIKRKNAFIECIDDIQENDPPLYSFLKLCKFYKDYLGKNSRLIRSLRGYLAELLGIKIPKSQFGPHGGNASHILSVIEKLHNSIIEHATKDFELVSLTK